MEDRESESLEDRKSERPESERGEEGIDVFEMDMFFIDTQVFF